MRTLLLAVSCAAALAAADFRTDVEELAARIGERNIANRPAQLDAAAVFIEKRFRQAGYQVNSQFYEVSGHKCRNLEVQVPGRDLRDEVVVIGAHYDSAQGTPGADDNASGVAGLLALARDFARSRPRRTLRFVAFVNEEPPYFQKDTMGSLVYAKECRRRGDRIVAMLSLETIGYYSDRPNTQSQLKGERRFPSTGNFILFAGNQASHPLLDRAAAAFRGAGGLPVEEAPLHGTVAEAGWSDHWSFWQQGYPGLMVTDTAPFRNRNYHQRTDTPATLDYTRLTRLLTGLAAVVKELAQ